MRISKEEIQFLKSKILSINPGSKVYLFGSRVDDNKKGGDIDILILADKKLSLKEKLSISGSFQMRFGEQKIDLVSFTFDEESAFKNYILDQAVEI